MQTPVTHAEIPKSREEPAAACRLHPRRRFTMLLDTTDEAQTVVGRRRRTLRSRGLINRPTFTELTVRPDFPLWPRLPATPCGPMGPSGP